MAAAEAEVGALKTAECKSDQWEIVDDLPRERYNATKRTEQYLKDPSYPSAYRQLPVNPAGSPFHPYAYAMSDLNRSPELFCPLPQPRNFSMNFQSSQNHATSYLTKSLLVLLLCARLTTFSEKSDAYLSERPRI